MNPTMCWPDKSLPGEIYFAPDVIKGLQIVATDGLLALPRIGLGVGGLLLGTRAPGRIDILKAVEIPCSHKFGPAFVLTADEIAAASGLRTPEPEAGNEANEDEADYEVVGWYCSKPTWPRDMQGALTEHDNALFNAFCPEPWQVVLLVRPSKGQGTMAVFGLRSGLGTPRDLGTALAPPEPVEELAEAPPAEEPATVAVQQTAAVEPPAAQPLVIPPPVIAPPVIPVPMARSGTLFGTPLVAREPEEEEREVPKWPRRILVVAILLVLLAAVAFFTRGYWLPKPPLAMLAASDWTGRVSFMWNSEALSEQSHAALIIDDGPGPLHTIHLTDKELRAGFFQFDCRPGRVTATLLAGEVSDAVTVTAKAETYLPESGISK